MNIKINGEMTEQEHKDVTSRLEKEKNQELIDSEVERNPTYDVRDYIRIEHHKHPRSNHHAAHHDDDEDGDLQTFCCQTTNKETKGHAASIIEASILVKNGKIVRFSSIDLLSTAPSTQREKTLRVKRLRKKGMKRSQTIPPLTPYSRLDNKSQCLSGGLRKQRTFGKMSTIVIN